MKGKLQARIKGTNEKNEQNHVHTFKGFIQLFRLLYKCCKLSPNQITLFLD